MFVSRVTRPIKVLNVLSGMLIVQIGDWHRGLLRMVSRNDSYERQTEATILCTMIEESQIRV